MSATEVRDAGPFPVFSLIRVTGVFEFAQVRDQVARRQPDHVLQAGEGERVAVGQCGEHGHDLESRGEVDEGVKRVSGHGSDREARSTQTWAAL